jgi:hypothetical protein
VTQADAVGTHVGLGTEQAIVARFVVVEIDTGIVIQVTAVRRTDVAVVTFVMKSAFAVVHEFPGIIEIGTHGGTSPE